jgi:hypothetical protein
MKAPPAGRSQNLAMRSLLFHQQSFPVPVWKADGHIGEMGAGYS